MYLCVKNCLVSGDITGDTYVGGIIGYIQQEYSSGITNSSFYGTVKGNSYVGGLTGYLGYNSAAYIKNSYCGASSVVGTSNTGIVVGYVSTSTSGTTTRYGSTTNIYYKDLQGLSVATLGDGSKINAQESDETNALTTLNTWAQTNNENEWSISNEELMAAHLPIFKVTILGYNDEVLSIQYVGNGLNANIPEVKEILGYEFSQWDSSFTNITGNTIIHAEYVTTPTYTVSFYGYDNLLISEVVVNKGKNAKAPTLPHVSGKIFDSWDTSFENVQENISVYANYIDGYVVRFYGMNGALISTQEIGKGLGAQEPEIPIIDGYHFDSWDKEFSDIQENTSVYASYEKNASNALQFNTLQVYLSKKSPSTQEMSTLATELQSAGVSIAFLYGVQVFPTLDETSAYGGAGMKSGRSSTGGLGYGILYQKSKYKVDPTATSSGATLQKDDCYFALPLQELVTGKQVVAVTLWTGSNSSTGTGTATTFQKLFTALQASYPNASNYLVGYHTNTPTTKGGSVGLTTSLQAVKLTGYNTKVLYEKQVGTAEEADYLINFSKGTLESTLLSSSKATSITLTTKDAHQGSFKVEDTNTSNKTYYVVSFLNPDDTLIENQYIESGHDATIPENITIPLGYELDSWVGSTTNITSNGAVKLALKEKMYHVIFKDSFGNVIEEKDVQEGSSVSYPTPQDDVVGYHFSSWTIESIDSILEDTEVIANYDKNVYTITYKDSKGNVLFEVPYEFDDEIEFPEVEEKITGYLFSHWVDSLGTIPQDGDKVSKNETYQTIFVESVEITFKTSLGDTIETITIPKGSKATYPQTPDVTGYEFESWSKASLDVANEDQTITANYKKKTFTITFLDYDGTKLQEISKEYLDEFDMPSYTAPEGHKFEGWYKGSTKVESKQTCQSNETYQVKVTKLKYEVLFKNEDGTQLSKTEVEYGSKVTLATPKLKVGYVFVSWMNGETPFDGTESITKALILTPSYQIDESIFNNAIATLENAQTLQNKKEAIQNVEVILGYWTESEVQSLDQTKLQTLQNAKEYYNQARLNALSDLSVIKRMF